MRENLKYFAFIMCGFSMIAITGCTQGGETVPSYQYSPQDVSKASLGYYTLQPRDTLLSVSQAYQVDLGDVIRLNDLAQPGKLGNGARIKIPAPKIYTVQPRDSLPRIAQLFDVSAAEIIRINHLSPPYQLRPGQVLRLSEPPHEDKRAIDAHLGGETQVAQTEGGRLVQSVITSESLPPLNKDSGNSVSHSARYHVAHESAGSVGSADFAKSARAPSGVLKYEQMEPQSNSQSGGQSEHQLASQAAHLTPVNIPASMTDMPRLNRSGFLTPVSGKIISNFGPKSDGLHNDGINISAVRGTPVRAAQNGVVVYAGDEISGFGHLVLIKHANDYITAYAHMDKMLAKKGDMIKRGQTIGTVGTSGHVARPQLHFEIRKGKRAVNPTNLIKI